MKSIWKRLHDIHKNAVVEEDNAVMNGYIIPCDECIHFGNCRHEKQCNEDVHTGRALEHFVER